MAGYPAYFQHTGLYLQGFAGFRRVSQFVANYDIAVSRDCNLRLLQIAYLCRMETSIPLTPKNAIHSLAVLITAEMRRYGIVSKEEDVEKAIAEIGLAFTFQIVDDAGKKKGIRSRLRHG